MKEDERQREARQALERVERDSGAFGSSALARSARLVGDHFAAKDAIGTGEAGGTDPAELWGRRIGRALSALGVLGLIYWLGLQSGWW